MKKYIITSLVLKHQTIISLAGIDTEEHFLYTMGKTRLTHVQRGKLEDAGFQVIDTKKLKDLILNNQIIGYDLYKVQQYLIRKVAEGGKQEELVSLQESLLEKPAYKLVPKPKGIYGVFEIANLVKQDISFEEICAKMGLDISPLPIYSKTSKVLTSEELEKVINYSVTITENVKTIFNHPYTKSAYFQQEAVIEKYLDGKRHFFSLNGSKLVTKALTRNGKFQNHKKPNFTWEFNGINVLDLIPEGWKNELLAYQKEMEEAMVEYQKQIAEGKDNFQAGKLFKEIPFPSYEFTVGDNLKLRTSGGGLHTDYQGQIVRENTTIHHDDIEGAYTEIILRMGIFSPEIAAIYQGFKEDKFRYKNCKKILDRMISDGDIDVSSLLEQFQKYNIHLPETISVGELISEISQGVAASKLATNKPTGVADQNGSELYNPIGMVEGRIVLQIILYDFARRVIELGGRVLSINTDGLFWIDNGLDLSCVKKEWEEFWGLKIGSETFDGYIAKSDNDRILLRDGVVVEASGDDLCHYQLDNLNRLGKKPIIVDRVVLKKLIYPERSLEEILDKQLERGDILPLMFTSKAPRSTKTVIGRYTAERVNRFLLTQTGETIGLYNLRTGNVGKVTNLPDSKITLYNDFIPKTVPENLNKQAYLEMIESVYSHWT